MVMKKTILMIKILIKVTVNEKKNEFINFTIKNNVNTSSEN